MDENTVRIQAIVNEMKQTIDALIQRNLNLVAELAVTQAKAQEQIKTELPNGTKS